MSNFLESVLDMLQIELDDADFANSAERTAVACDMALSDIFRLQRDSIELHRMKPALIELLPTLKDRSRRGIDTTGRPVEILVDKIITRFGLAEAVHAALNEPTF